MSGIRASRRQFLAAGASTCLAPAILRARGSELDKVRVGFIGVGAQGSALLGQFLADARARILAVCDVNAKHLEQAVHRVGQCRPYSDFQEMLARDDIDAVAIAAPDQWHASMAIAAARAGKHIYCEKPVARNIPDSRAVVDAVRQYGVKYQAGLQRRSDPHYSFAARLVRDGNIGQLQRITIECPSGPVASPLFASTAPAHLDYSAWLGPAPYRPYARGVENPSVWPFLSDFSAGPIGTWGIHDLDIALWALGSEPMGRVVVEAIGDRRAPGAVAAWQAKCRFEDDVILDYRSIAEGPGRLGFEGTAGWIEVRPGQIRTSANCAAPAVGRCALAAHLGQFLDAIVNEQATIAPAEAAHRATTIGLLCELSLRLGRALKWDMATERGIDDPAANPAVAGHVPGTSRV